uniref:Uncharacterized protein n=1 Tax=Pararge aegeria TaxID=116150 RepID=S4PJY5_9NEOP
MKWYRIFPSFPLLINHSGPSTHIRSGIILTPSHPGLCYLTGTSQVIYSLEYLCTSVLYIVSDIQVSKKTTSVKKGL